MSALVGYPREVLTLVCGSSRRRACIPSLYMLTCETVAARTRQLNHRLKGRKQAILDRRANASPAPPIRPSSPSNVALMSGAAAQSASANLASLTQSSHSSPGGGFVAVNARPHHEQNGNGASRDTRHELLSKFHTLSDRRASSQPTNGASDLARRPSIGQQQAPSHPATPLPSASKPPPKPAEPPNLTRAPPYSDTELPHMMNSPVPIPNTPSSLLPAASQRASQPAEKDDGGPFKAEMVHRMETLAKGERILPPCDRCRRLHMDCLKNLTACMGCTKKHAKCSWKEVRENEVRGSFSHHVEMRGAIHSEGEDVESRERTSTGSPATPPAHGMTPISNNHGAGGSQPTVSEARMIVNRFTPPRMDTERERGVEVQLQEAAVSSLAHANARMGGPETKGSDYQTMVA